MLAHRLRSDFSLKVKSEPAITFSFLRFEVWSLSRFARGETPFLSPMLMMILLSHWGRIVNTAAICWRRERPSLPAKMDGPGSSRATIDSHGG